MDIKNLRKLQITTIIHDVFIIQSYNIVFRPTLEYCDIDDVMTVVHLTESLDDSGCEVRFSFPRVLLWAGDHFGYVKELYVLDVVSADTREEAFERMEQRIAEIFRWEHRRFYDGLSLIIPSS